MWNHSTWPLSFAQRTLARHVKFHLPSIPIASRNRRICSLEKETRAGEARFGFLEFGDVERGNVKALRFDACACTREGSGKDDCAVERQDIGGVRCGRIERDP